MSIAPALAAYLGSPPASIPVATRAHRLGDDTTTENPMPSGVYVRKKKAAKAAEKPEAKDIDARLRDSEKALKKIIAAKPVKAALTATKGATATLKDCKRILKQMKAPNKARASGPRFGVFEDGTVELRLAGCKGTIGPEDARDLNAFITRLQVK